MGGGGGGGAGGGKWVWGVRVVEVGGCFFWMG